MYSTNDLTPPRIQRVWKMHTRYEAVLSVVELIYITNFVRAKLRLVRVFFVSGYGTDYGSLFPAGEGNFILLLRGCYLEALYWHCGVFPPG